MAGYYLAALVGLPGKRAMPSTRVNVLRLFNSFFIIIESYEACRPNILQSTLSLRAPFLKGAVIKY